MNDEALRRIAERSMRAQALASKRQAKALDEAERPNPWPCISCGKPIEKHEQVGYENGAVVMCSLAGYGSRHDTSKVQFVVCDDCVEAKAVIAEWPLDDAWKEV